MLLKVSPIALKIGTGPMRLIVNSVKMRLISCSVPSMRVIARSGIGKEGIVMFSAENIGNFWFVEVNEVNFMFG